MEAWFAEERDLGTRVAGATRALVAYARWVARPAAHAEERVRRAREDRVRRRRGARYRIARLLWGVVRRERAEVAMKTAGRLQSTVARGACGENGFDEIDIFPQKATDPARYTHSYAPCPSSSASTRDLNSGFFFTVTSSSGSGSINGTLCAGSPYSRVTMPPRS